MLTKKETEAIIYFANDQKPMYLAKLFKYLYFYQLQSLIDCGEVFFKNCDFTVHPTCPIPMKIWTNIESGELFKKNPDVFYFDSMGKRLTANNVRLFKIRSMREYDKTEFGAVEITRLERIKYMYNSFLPSKMNENMLFKKSLWREYISDGREGQVMDLNEYFEKKERKY